MISSRPYLLRAFFEWIVDNETTPYIVVNADYLGVVVPREFVENGRIVLNISPMAVRELELANDHVKFNARFGLAAHDIFVPIKAITAIYAKENGRGMVFKDEDGEELPPEDNGEDEKGGSKGKKGNGRPNLTVVK